MIAELKPYPSLKRSGVPWLDRIPDHWQIQRLRHVAELRVSNVDKHIRDDEQPVRLCNYTDVYKHDRISERMPFMRASASADEIERFRLNAGDVLITKDSETWHDIGVPALVEDSADDLISGYHLALLRSHALKIIGPYLFRTFQAAAVAHQLHVEANGVTRYGLAQGAIKSVWIPLPPLTEQAAIVRFLDQVDGRVTRYLNAKQTLIKLLEEQKQAIVHDAVTHGLDPTARIRASGAVWLGDVPEHWQVHALSRTAISWCDGPFGSGLKSSHYVEEGVRVVRLQNIGHGEFRDSSAAFISPDHYATLGEHGVVAGDLLVAGLGDDRHPAGRACVAPASIAPAMVKADCFRFRLDSSRVVPEFVALQLTATAPAAAAVLSTGATRQRTNLSTTASRPIALPSPAEQASIVESVRRDAEPIERSIASAKRSIGLAREYRSRLVSDVVTGKVDVGSAAARLPDDDRDLSPLREIDGISNGPDDPDLVVDEVTA